MAKNPKARKRLLKPEAGKIRLREYFPWLAVLGSILVFASWILQNRFTADVMQERTRLQNSQTVIDLEQLRMEQWQIMYLTEKRKQNPDPEILLPSVFKALQAYLNLSA
ncbi:hypothetical protein ES703_65030 [subsurface metagenome]